MHKILWLYKYFPMYDFDHFLHMSYAKFVSSYPGVYLKAYGPGLDKGYPIINLFPYHRNITLEQISKEYDFDVIVVNTKSRCFDYYDPKRGIAQGCWLPPDFGTWTKTPKIVIEEDYHYEKGDDWYEDIGIDLILQRHYSQSLRQDKVPMKFFPFSVDNSYFNSSSTEVIYDEELLSLPYVREKKICFVGNVEDPCYKYRAMASEMLDHNGLCANFGGSKKVNGKYLEALRKYVGYISCGSTHEICAGKNFEIMASGGILFTNKFVGIEKIFPEDTYCSFENDGSDILEKANKLLFDQDYAINILQNARKCVYEKHTHDIRILEMLDIFKEEI